jgi:hypothetical protein
MVGAAACGIQRETPLRDFSHEQFVADLQLVEKRSEISGGNQFEEELEFTLVR